METHATGHPAKRERSSGHEPPDAASKRQKAQSHPLQPAATAHASQPLPSQQEEAELDQDPIIHIFNPFNYPRKRASIACEICRVRKTRCDAARPRCSSCAQLGVACTYRKLAIGVRSLTTSRPEQTATENFLSSIASRLDRIEALILDQNGRPGPATNYSYAASSPSIQAATGSGSNSYPTPSSPVIIPAPAVPPTATEATRIRRMGLSMYAMSQLNGHEAPPSLKILQYEESEPFLEWEMERGKRLYQARSHDDLDFSLSVCWRLQQSFSERILSWFPLFNLDRCVEVVNKLHEPRLGSSDIDKCLALFILALGALSKANHITSDKPAALSGLDYFCAASDILDLDKDSRYTIIEAQCHLLKALYLLLCLRPLQASDAVFSAARSILAVFDLPSRLAKDPLLKESCHRTFWTCFLLEHELKPLISYNPQLLQLVNESVPLPLSHDHEQSIYWFLAEIALRRIFSHCIEDVRVESHLMYNPKVTKVLAEQLYEWYKGLPTRLQFEFDTKPLLDHQKAFLRGQYYVLLLIIYWPSVVRLLTKELDSEISEKQREELYTDALKAINYGVAYVFATESLLLERHQMVFGNVMG
ncbi:hypothetical protein AOQ84DRAFT_346657 [Glonium stellatum]|uniref:Zn(2)-C6 fungal-type domain-containing protein n=1 Tax=Glonium stellatum TaxID=574774 RepID=A0A8E2ESN5_9PEZI|nr:hypothetical protein AOQ84DRAFT_346657 [Glonium stellatum]